VVAPASACGSSTFSAAVSIGSRKNRWNTKPIWRSRSLLRAASDRLETSWPSKSSVPAVGLSTHPSIWSRVDLPHPDGPRMAACSPAPISSVTSRTAVTGPAGIAN
jgi:hypothetical protein